MSTCGISSVTEYYLCQRREELRQYKARLALLRSQHDDLCAGRVSADWSDARIHAEFLRILTESECCMQDIDRVLGEIDFALDTINEQLEREGQLAYGV